MKNIDTRKIVLTGLFAAIIFLATKFLALPLNIPAIPSAYINAGDVAILVAAYILGGPLAAIAAGFGSVLADLITPGAMIYAPATLIIKALVGLISGVMLNSKYFTFTKIIIAFILAELTMAFGYFIYELILYKNAAFVSLPLNLLQALFGVVAGTFLTWSLSQVPYIKNLRNNR